MKLLKRLIRWFERYKTYTVADVSTGKDDTVVIIYRIKGDTIEIISKDCIPCKGRTADITIVDDPCED